MTTEPRIYVADLAAYNSGYLHGVWIDATLDASDIQDQVNAMLEQSPVGDAEEYAIHGMTVGSYATITDLIKFQKLYVLPRDDEVDGYNGDTPPEPRKYTEIEE